MIQQQHYFSLYSNHDYLCIYRIAGQWWIFALTFDLDHSMAGLNVDIGQRLIKYIIFALDVLRMRLYPSLFFILLQQFNQNRWCNTWRLWPSTQLVWSMWVNDGSHLKLFYALDAAFVTSYSCFITFYCQMFNFIL